MKSKAFRVLSLDGDGMRGIYASAFLYKMQSNVLIDGQRLTHLMIAHNIGCTPQRNRLIKQFDRDHFDVD